MHSKGSSRPPQPLCHQEFWILAGAVPANIAFTMVLTTIDTDRLLVGMSLVTMATGLHFALRRDRPNLSDRALNVLAVPAGLLSGFLGGLFGMGGPPLIILLGRASADPTLFRARTSMVGTLMSFLRVGVLLAAGAFTAETGAVLALTTPFILAGTAAGLWAHKYVRARAFRSILGFMLVLGGASGLMSSSL